MKKFNPPKIIKLNTNFNFYKPPNNFNFRPKLYRPQPIKKSKFSRFQDFDGDNVPNWKDCRPWNPHKQHLSKPMKRRIRRLPIVASPVSMSEEKRKMFERNMPELEKIGNDDDYVIEKAAALMKSRRLPHIMSKEAREQSPEAQRLFFTTVKDYPGIIGEIEKAKPKKVIIASRLQPKDESQRGWTAPTEEVYISPRTPYYSKAHRKKLAKMTYHELKHIEQLKEKPLKEVLEEIGEEYEDRPMEKEAMEYSEQKMKEYHKGRAPTGKAISKTLMLDEENQEDD